MPKIRNYINDVNHVKMGYKWVFEIRKYLSLLIMGSIKAVTTVLIAI